MDINKVVKEAEPGWGGVEVSLTLNGRQYNRYWAGESDFKTLKRELKKLSSEALKEASGV